MSKFLINSFLGGISEFADRGISGAFQWGRNLFIDTQKNTITNDFDFFTIGSGIVTDLILWLVPSITGKVYCFGSSGKIYELTPGDNASISLKYTDSDGRIKGASEWYLNNGNTYLYWATDTKLKRKVLPGASDWSDAETVATNLTSADWHTMKIALGQLLIANGNNLALVGYDGSYTNQALDLFKANQVVSLLKRANSVLLGTKRNTNDGMASLFTWDTMSLSWNSEKEIPYSPIYGLIDTDIPIGFCGNGYLVYTDLINTIPILQIKGGGKINPGAIVSHRGKAVFGVYNNSNGENGLYVYGREFKNETHILNLKKYVNCDEIGAVLSCGDKLYFSYKSGSSYYLVGESRTSYSSEAIYRSLILSPEPEILKEHLWNNVLVYIEPLPNGADVKLYYKTNKLNSFKEASQTATPDAGATIISFNIGEIAHRIEIELKLISVFNGANYVRPTVKALEVYFE